MINNQSGLTIVELMVTVSVAAIISTVMLIITLNFYGSVIGSQVAAEMATNSHFALRSMVEDLRVADKIAPNSVLTDDNKPGGWTTNDLDNVFIINKPATDSSINIVYNDETSQPYTNQLIYYVEDGNLHKRSLKNDAAPGNTLTTSCPSSSTDSTCPPDIHYASHVSDISFTFYDTTNTPTTNPDLARSVEITLAMEREIFGSVIKNSNSIYTKLRN